MYCKAVFLCHCIPLISFAFFTAGCADLTAPDEELDTAVHDFGTIYEMPEGNRLMHEFPILNDGESPISLQVLAANCSCVTTDQFAKAFEMAPGESIVVPVYISLHGINGPFIEELALETVDGDFFRTLRVAGFVDRYPMAVENPVEIQFGASDKQATNVVTVVKIRSKSLPQPATIDRILIDSSESTKFSIGEITHVSKKSGQDAISDLWSFPISYSGQQTTTAIVQVYWIEFDAVTSIRLETQPRQLARFAQRELTFAPMEVGEKSIVSIVLRLNADGQDLNLRAAGRDGHCSVSIDIESKKVLVSVEGHKKGIHTEYLDLFAGDQLVDTAIVNWMVK